MPKIKSGINVLDAAKNRVSMAFDNFNKVYVSYSGGKDSTVMLHLVAEEAKRRNRKIGLLFIDLEGQYKMTIEHIRECWELYADIIIPFWCCIPLHLRNAVSVYESFWICWDKEKKESWIDSHPMTL